MGHLLTVSADIVEKHGPIDVIILNAGYIHQGTLEESTPAEIQKQFDVNVFGLVSHWIPSHWTAVS